MSVSRFFSRWGFAAIGFGAGTVFTGPITLTTGTCLKLAAGFLIISFIADLAAEQGKS